MQHLRAQLAAIVGGDHVMDEMDVLETYASDHSGALGCCPVAVVRPGDEQSVRALVAWARETGTPLVPVSSPAPHFHGDTVPAVDGAVIVELGRMDRVLRVDRRNRMVVIEPGVGYAALQAQLADHGMRVTPPLLPRAGKSVVASLLERQPTLIPRYNYSLPEPLRDCGVVWGSGDVLYTGEAGSASRSLEEQWNAGIVQAEPKGPAQTDFYRLLTGAQGTLGIVTWASVKCELLAEAHRLGFVTAERLDDLVPLVYRLCLLRLGDEVMIFNRAYLGRMLAASGGCDVASGGARELPAWTLVLGFGGRRYLADARVRAQEEDAAHLATEHGLALRGELPGAKEGAVDELMRGFSPEPHWKLAADGGSADVFFLTTLDKAAGYVTTMQAAVRAHGFSSHDMGVYIQPQHQGASHHVELSLPYDVTELGERRRAELLVAEAGAELIAGGAYFSRPYGPWAEPAYARDPASTEALRKIKRIFDPGGIMNPGKLCFTATAKVGV